MNGDESEDGSFNRRTYLAALGTATATGLAGCSGGNGNGGNGSGGNGGGGGGNQGELGERVPNIQGVALGGVAGAAGIEQGMQHVKQQLNEVLGLQMEVVVKELTTFWNEAYNDARTFSLHIDLSPPFPSNLDPNGLLMPFHIRNAGANGGPNSANYADCNYSQKADAQASASTTEERRQLVTEAVAAASEDFTPLTLVSNVNESAYRTDQLEVVDIGTIGANERNPQLLWNTAPKGDADGKVMNMTPGNFPSVAYMAARPATPWTGTVYLPLVIRDKNYELAPGLATDWEISNEFTEFTFDLHEDATFHNGDPVTAEDAKWTLEFLNDNSDQFSPIGKLPYDSIEAVDEKTLKVTMSESQPAWINAFVPVWSGVLPKKVWTAAGAEENPTNPEFDEIVGSGPYQVANYQPRQLLALEPYEDHFIDAKGNLTFRGYQDRQSARRAFEDGTLNLLQNISGNTPKQIQDNMGSTAEVVAGESFSSWELRSQHSFGPTMFPEFRHAVSQSISRLLLNEFLESGKGEPELYASLLGKNHPWRPDSNDPLTKVASPEPNAEKAKQVLRDAGWGWDDSGRLHYPADADLTPQWPKESSPCQEPDAFPCVPDICE
ncbi:ABC transporter substrate-binding protein [Halobium palmae]|uniref:ABC transporter substrate-binding protein n=1 Tax=Halobium palmae TaxID=1776492 RepID=A0ABD5RY63_9EURY